MNNKPLVVFAHGKESGPWGSKIIYLADIAKQFGASVLSPDYSDLLEPDDRVRRLIELPLPPHSELLLVGSSMGGYVSMMASSRLKPVGLFMMAPALYMPGYSDQYPEPMVDRISIVHGWNDLIIPVEHSIRFAKKYHSVLHIVESDHRLNDALDQLGDFFRSFMKRTIGKCNSLTPGLHEVRS